MEHTAVKSDLQHARYFAVYTQEPLRAFAELFKFGGG